MVGAVACLAGILIIGGMSAKKYDELTRQISLEASAGAFYTTLLLIGGWAALAHLGYVAWLSPLAFVSALALLLIIAIFIVSARKGLLIR